MKKVAKDFEIIQPDSMEIIIRDKDGNALYFDSFKVGYAHCADFLIPFSVEKDGKKFVLFGFDLIPDIKEER